nr:FlaD/FlaE family flagellar protein [uncultured Methanolobus sp.]
MSELPWENKKVAEIISSVEGDKSSANTSGEKNSSTPPIPDILANAFADIPMEEAKIEVHEDSPSPADSGAPQASFPSFGDLPDLSALGGTPPNAPPVEKKEAPMGMPPFMNAPPNADQPDMVPSLDQPPEPSSVGKSAKKRSPPPLFEPFVGSKEPHGISPPCIGEPAPPFVPGSSEPLPFDPQVEKSQFPTPGPFTSPVAPAESNPFESMPGSVPPADPFASAGVPSESNPFGSTPGSVPPADPFASAGVPAESNPFGSTPGSVPPADPFASAGVSSESNPFGSTPGSVPPADPFASAGVSSESNPFGSTPGSVPPADPFASAGVSSESNPFGSTPGSVPPADPFASAGVSSGDPFASGVVPVESNPFAPTSGVIQPGNPFGGSVPDDAGSFEKSKHSQKSQGKLPIDIGSFKKNFGGISGITKGLLKNLTKGKSLIERMEDMREEVDFAESARQDTGSKAEKVLDKSPFDSNPFETPQDNIDSNPFLSSFNEDNPVVQATFNEPVTPSIENGGGEGDDDGVDDIRQVTPIENPIMEMKEEYLIDSEISDDAGVDGIVLPKSDNVFAEASDPFVNVADSSLVVNDIVNDAFTMPQPDNVAESMAGSDGSVMPEQFHHSLPELTDVEAGAKPELSKISESVSSHENTSSASGMELSRKVFSKELKDIKITTDKKLENLENDIGGLEDSLNDMNLQFSSMHSEVEEFSNRISEITESVAAAVSLKDALSQNNSRFDAVNRKISQVESKVSGFDSSITSLQSDNVSMKADMSQIEESITELVGSYTALLAQLHESLQENESKFAILAEVSSKIDSLGPRVELIEKMQEESKSTSKEFSRSMSSMVDTLGKVSSEFQEFRQQSEQKNVAVMEKIDSLTEYMESELKKLGARSYKGFGQNVHLSNIVKNSSNMKLCMEWLEFLMELVGRNNLPDILSYYEELGWITEKVRMELLHYAEGIDFYMEKPDWKLTPDDHVKSIWFIESLAGMKVDKNRLSVIERDIEKVKKGSEIYGI